MLAHRASSPSLFLVALEDRGRHTNAAGPSSQGQSHGYRGGEPYTTEGGEHTSLSGVEGLDSIDDDPRVANAK